MIIAVECGETIDIFPNYRIGGMKNMGAILVVLNPGISIFS
jgi:hypothetical protein